MQSNATNPAILYGPERPGTQLRWCDYVTNINAWLGGAIKPSICRAILEPGEMLGFSGLMHYWLNYASIQIYQFSKHTYANP